MKIQELRIGNKVLFNGIECSIDSIGSCVIEVAGQDFHYSAPIEQLMPVPLTEQHLIELGFEKIKDKYVKNGFKIRKYNDFFTICIFIEYSNFNIELKSVHKIQNLLCDLDQE